MLEDPIFPPTETLRLESMGMELPVWSGTVDIIVPFYPVGELASETRPLDRDTAELEVQVRYQACDDAACFPPRTETLSLALDLDHSTGNPSRKVDGARAGIAPAVRSK